VSERINLQKAKYSQKTSYSIVILIFLTNKSYKLTVHFILTSFSPKFYFQFKIKGKRTKIF